jgi:hypothetical protein
LHTLTATDKKSSKQKSALLFVQLQQIQDVFMFDVSLIKGPENVVFQFVPISMAPEESGERG